MPSPPAPSAGAHEIAASRMSRDCSKRATRLPRGELDVARISSAFRPLYIALLVLDVGDATLRRPRSSDPDARRGRLAAPAIGTDDLENSGSSSSSSLVGYFLLEGSLRGGMLRPSCPDDEERSAMFESIGPVWDGNEVWLVTAGATSPRSRRGTRRCSRPLPGSCVLSS